MKLVALGLVAVGMVLAPGAHAQDVVSHLHAEANRIIAEGERIRKHAELMRSEAARLNQEATNLRAAAARLDAMWESARRAAPSKVADYAGRDRSQQRLRQDADREDRDATDLLTEGRRLDDEALRLNKVAEGLLPQQR